MTNHTVLETEPTVDTSLNQQLINTGLGAFAAEAAVLSDNAQNHDLTVADLFGHAQRLGLQANVLDNLSSIPDKKVARQYVEEYLHNPVRLVKAADSAKLKSMYGLPYSLSETARQGGTEGPDYDTFADTLRLAINNPDLIDTLSEAANRARDTYLSAALKLSEQKAATRAANYKPLGERARDGLEALVGKGRESMRWLGQITQLDSSSLAESGIANSRSTDVSPEELQHLSDVISCLPVKDKVLLWLGLSNKSNEQLEILAAPKRDNKVARLGQAAITAIGRRAATLKTAVDDKLLEVEAARLEYLPDSTLQKLAGLAVSNDSFEETPSSPGMAPTLSPSPMASSRIEYPSPNKYIGW